MCFLLSNNSIFPCKNLNLRIFYTELRLSLYKCVKLYSGASDDAKLNYYPAIINRLLFLCFIDNS